MINNYRYLETYIQEQTKQETALYENVNRKNIGRDILSNKSVDIVTLVNLLGSYGNFETDSNGDGLADGWQRWGKSDVSLSTDSVFGDKSQQFKLDVDKYTSFDTKYKVFKNTHKYFFKINFKNAGGSSNFLIRYTNNTIIKNFGIGEYTSFTSFYTSFTSIFADMGLRLNFDTYNSSGTSITNEIDGACLYDLTEMGALPRALQDKYGVTNWTDLTADQLNAELDYVDSVKTFGYSWNTGEKVEVIENREVNLWNTNEFVKRYDNDDYQILNNKVFGLQLNMAGYLIKVKPNKTYTLKGKWNSPINGCQNVVRIKTYSVKPQSGNGTVSTFTERNINFTNNNNKITFTTSTNETYISLTSYNAYNDLIAWFDRSSIMLYEGTDDKEYIPPRKDKLSINTYGFNYFGLSDTITDSKVKLWEKQEIVKSTTFLPTSKSGKGTCVLIKQDDGQVFFNTISGTNITESTEPDGTYTVFYQLETPEFENIQIQDSLTTLNSTDNQFVYSSEKIITFESDGITTVYTHNLNSTDYNVFINGELAQPIKNANDIEFNEPPKNGSIIEIKQRTDSNNMYVYADILENTDIETNLYPVSSLEFSENIQEVRTTTSSYGEIRKAVNKTYSVKIDKDIAKNLDIELDANKTYKIRAVLEDGTVHHFCNGKIASKGTDVYNSNRSYTIIFTDFYKE